ncbi:ras-like GTP-binding protein rhoA [Tribolium castaneum]|uniref:Ras-like GTP-binding protein Rho1 n=1 Tax=Tribolium castaneum TaxID=7070 RepID=D6WTQ3_TRICA|nr:PREDICTED: ras-like GTP-binding protein rhoA [Tribolium castaneum]EFA06292.1 Ras-like GTP-binding protein Rho1 [Tribolium castaneum]|eukprot:XP_974464.1 PREDICTED: ras-like GTP-binding protein rhoA [Tribolium castaneum]
MSSVQKKLIIVGDGACGKTCLLIAFAKDIFNSEYRPTVFENYVADVELDALTVELSLWDTSGQEDYDRLRPIQYPETDVVLICFSVMWRDSLLNVSAKWCPEVRHFCPNVPILLIGTKNDLREDKEELEKLKMMKKSPVTRDEAEAMARTIGAVCYIECSAKTKYNVQEVFKEAARATIAKRKKRKQRCVLI